MQRQLVSSLTKIMLACVVGIALQPIIMHSEVMPILVKGAQVVSVLLPVAASVLVVGYVHHRLQLWRATRPAFQVEPAQAFGYTTQASGPRLANEAAQLLYEEKQSDDDQAEIIRDRIIQFAFIGHYTGFGWRSMCRYVGRRDWRNCVVTMQAANVLTTARGNVAPTWTPGWRYSKFRIAVKWQGLDLPYPTDEPVPTIDWRKWLTVTQ